MLYYRVVKKYDGFSRKPNGKAWDIFVADELYTPYEAKRYLERFPLAFEAVNIPKTKTHWFFGCRFEDKPAQG